MCVTLSADSSSSSPSLPPWFDISRALSCTRPLLAWTLKIPPHSCVRGGSWQQTGWPGMVQNARGVKPVVLILFLLPFSSSFRQKEKKRQVTQHSMLHDMTYHSRVACAFNQTIRRPHMPSIKSSADPATFSQSNHTPTQQHRLRQPKSNTPKG